MATQRRIDGDIHEGIQIIALQRTWTPAQIYRYLDDQPEFVGRIPSQRTIQRIVREFRVNDLSDEWSISDSDPDDAAAVLHMLSQSIKSGFVDYGVGKGITKQEVFWYLHIKKIAPDLSFIQQQVLSNLYRIREQKKNPTNELDAYLALSPWRCDQDRDNYKDLVNRGRIPPVPMWEVMVDGGIRWSHIPDQDNGS
jgi:hypothetical protein